MNQETFHKFEEQPPFSLRSITTVDTVCPVCKKHIRFIVPDDIGLKSLQKENEYWRNEVHKLHFELRKIEELARLRNSLTW